MEPEGFTWKPQIIQVFNNKIKTLFTCVNISCVKIITKIGTNEKKQSLLKMIVILNFLCKEKSSQKCKLKLRIKFTCVK